jgi:biotin carboxylase
MAASDCCGRVVLLLRVSGPARVPVYKHFRRLGITLVVVHPVTNDNFAGCFDHWIYHDTNDVEALDRVLAMELPRLLGADGRVDAILSFDEYGVYPAACLAVRRGLRPIPLSPASLQTTSIKSAFRALCAAHGIRSPGSAVLRSPSDPVDEALLRGMHFPVVIKPSPGAGSLLAKLCLSLQDLQQHATHMWDFLATHTDVKHFEALGTKVHLLVEEYIGGQEVDIDCVIENGVVRFASISDNFEVIPPYFVEMGGLCPSALPDYAKQSLLELLDAYVRAEGKQLHGVLHFEAKYDFSRQAAYVIEVNCRLGSAETNTMLKTAYNGLELGECLVRCALGLPLDSVLSPEHTTPSAFAASVNIYPIQEGALRRIAVDETDPDLVDFNIFAKVGQKVAPPPASFVMICWLVASGDTEAAAVANIRRLTSGFVQDYSIEKV